MASPLNDPKLEALLDRLHAQSDVQVAETDAYFANRVQEGTLDKKDSFDDQVRRFYADKMVALDRDKAEFCYLLCRALRATRIVEAGTSFGVSTLYLAAAVRDNQGENGVTFEGDDGWIFVSRGRIGASDQALIDEPLPDDAEKLYVSNGHALNFLDCIRTRRQPICTAEIGHRSVTVCHIANICLRLGGRKLNWDAENERFVDDGEANRMLDREPRDWDA